PNQQVSAFDFGARQVAPTATVGGFVFTDKNLNGVYDSADFIQTYWHVYLDSNNNGQPDPGEPDALTDGTGHYVLTVLAGQSQTVRPWPGGNYTTLPPSGEYDVDLPEHGTVTGQDFGLVYGANVNG